VALASLHTPLRTLAVLMVGRCSLTLETQVESACDQALDTEM
jgi:hypothetical protein